MMRLTKPIEEMTLEELEQKVREVEMELFISRAKTPLMDSLLKQARQRIVAPEKPTTPISGNT